MTYGAIDIGFRLSVFRFMTEGINEFYEGFNI